MWKCDKIAVGTGSCTESEACMHPEVQGFREFLTMHMVPLWRSTPTLGDEEE